jgi:hypothetical protein
MVMRAVESVCQAEEISVSTLLLARIVDGAGRPIGPTDVRQLVCGVREIDSCWSGRLCVGVSPANAILPELVVDELWKVDDVGYNFRHDIGRLVNIVAALASGHMEVKYDFRFGDERRAEVRFYLRVAPAERASVQGYGVHSTQR